MLGVVLLLLISFLPGLGLTRILDGSADRTRRFLLAPALGLLLIFGISGFYVLITQRWTWLEISLCILLVNLLGLYVIRHRVEEVEEMSPWLKLEAAMGGEVIVDEILDDEATTQRWIQDSRSNWFNPVLLGAGIIALLPLIIFWSFKSQQKNDSLIFSIQKNFLNYEFMQPCPNRRYVERARSLRHAFSTDEKLFFHQ